MSELAILGGKPVWTGNIPRWPVYGAEEENALHRALHRGWWQQSTEVAGFEDDFANYNGVSHAICVTNGSATLTLALKAIGISPGEEVIVPNETFSGVPMSVIEANAVPVFVDIELETLNLDPDAVLNAITPRTKAVMVTHIRGIPARLDRLINICRDKGLIVIEDNAQGLGSEWCSKKLGTIGDIGSFSFQSAKMIVSGDGGALVTNSDELAGKLRQLREFGKVPSGKDQSERLLGGNYRMTEFQAAILSVQLKRLDAQIKHRAERVADFENAIRDIPAIQLWQLDKKVTRWNHYALVLRYNAESLNNLSLSQFGAALKAEGFSGCEAGGMVCLNTMKGLTSNNPATNWVAVKDQLLQARWQERRFPNCETASNIAFSIHHGVLNGPTDCIIAMAEAMHKICDNADQLVERISHNE